MSFILRNFPQNNRTHRHTHFSSSHNRNSKQRENIPESMSPPSASQQKELPASPYSLNFQPYLPSDAVERLKSYKYEGKDKSYIYNYFWKPLCERTVEMLPFWLPPNVITVAALIPIVVTHFLAWWYMPYMQAVDPNLPNKPEREAPAWVWIACAASLLVYQLMDNLDGYQARRTKTPSALGLLVDHGCDAINVVFSVITLSTCLQLGGSWKTIISVVVATFSFFMNTLEHHYIGKLILPVINGPNEGQFIMIGLYIFTAAVGCGVWLSEVAVVPPQLEHLLVSNSIVAANTFQCTAASSAAGGAGAAWGCVRLHTLPLTSMICMALLTWTDNFVNIHNSVTDKEGPAHGIYTNSAFAKRYPFLHALNRAFPVVLFEALALVWFVWSPSDIFRRHPRLFVWSLGFMITKMTLHLMVAHMLRLEYHPMRRSVVPFFFLALHTTMLGVVERLDDGGNSGGGGGSADATNKARAVHETVMLFEFFALSACSYTHAAINILIETAMACNRRMFTITDVPEWQQADKERKAKSA